MILIKATDITKPTFKQIAEIMILDNLKIVLLVPLQ